MSRTLLVDGDTLVFSAASSSEYEAEWNENLWTLHADLQQAVARFDDLLSTIVKALSADRVIVALSCEGPRWRPKIMPTYKANRKKTRKPVVYAPLRQYVHETQETFERPTLEGDDVLGILATNPTLVKGEKIVVAIDKDMKTFPALHYNYEHPERGIVEVTLEEADRFHMLQTLAGDATDGYGGCPGIGMSTAEKLLDDGRILEPVPYVVQRGPRKGTQETRWEPGKPGTPWEIVVSAYNKAGLNESVAVMNARVARICRHSDYNYSDKCVVLWQPPIA